MGKILLENEHDAAIVVHASCDPGNFFRMKQAIQPGEQIYVRSWVIENESNPDRPIMVCSSLENSIHEEDKTFILPSEIRGSKALVFNFKNGKVTYKKIDRTISDLTRMGKIKTPGKKMSKVYEESSMP